MNFIDAGKALKEGKCRAIRRSCWASPNGIRFDSVYEFVYNDNTAVKLDADDFLAEDWELVNPIKQYEEVEVVKWLNVITNEIFDFPLIPFSKDFIKLTGTIKKEIMLKVKKREEIKDAIEVISKDRITKIAPISKIFLEWEE